MAKKEREFKGGDKLKGIYKDYHSIMMQNELAGGKGAYEFMRYVRSYTEWILSRICSTKANL